MVASRTFLNAARPAARRNLPRPQAYRHYATVQSTPAQQQGANSSHIASGVAGGAVVLGLA